MTAHTSYTSEEWKILCAAPLSVGGAVSAASPSGVVGTFKEGMAIVNGMLNAAHNHPGNQLIQDVAPIGLNREQIDSLTNTARGMLRQSQADNAQAMEICHQVATVLQHKSNPAEAEEYKRWLMEIGQDVASSANEGANVLNMGGTAVSKEEAQTLHNVADALGLPNRS
jgi:hypothetical protein